MQSVYPFAIPILLAAAFFSAAALYLWQRRPAVGTIPATLLMLALTMWELAYAMQLVSLNLATGGFWLKIAFTGFSLVPPLWLEFTWKFTGFRTQWKRLGQILVWGITLGVVGLAWSNDAHHLIWQSILLERYSGMTFVRPLFASTYYFYLVLVYLMILAGVGFVLYNPQALNRFRRTQRAAFGLSLGLPYLLHFVQVSGLNPLPQFDLAAYGLLFSGIALTWGLYGFRFFDLIPTAREVYFQSMQDGVLVIDARTRIRDINPEALKLLKQSKEHVVGVKASEVIPQCPELRRMTINVPEFHKNVELREGDNRQILSLQVSPLYNRIGLPSGHLVILRDVTQQEEEQAALERRAADLEVLNAILGGTMALKDLHTIAEVTLSLSVQVFQARYGVMWLGDQIASQGLPPETGPALQSILGEAKKSKPETILVGDWSAQNVEQHSAIYQVLKGLEQPAVLAAPVIISQAAGGWIVLLDHTPRIWVSEEAVLIETIGRQLGVVVERLLHSKEIQVHNALLSRLVKQSEALSRHFSIDEVIAAVQQSAMVMVKADRVEVSLSEEEIRAAQSQKPVLIADVRELTDGSTLQAMGRNLDYRAIGLWPLVYEGKTTAMLKLYFDQPHDWSSVEEEVLYAFSRQAAVAIENARLMEAEGEQRAMTDALRDMTSALNSTLDFDIILERILENLDRVVPHDNANIMVIEKGIARVARSRGYQGEGQQEWLGSLRLTIQDTPTLQQMWESGETVLIADTVGDPSWVDLRKDSAVKSYVGTPIHRKGEIIGFINVNSRTPFFYNQKHAEQLQAFSDQAAIAVENATLYENLRRQVEETSALYRAATQLLNPGSDFHALAEQIAQAVTREFVHAHCSVFLLEDTGERLRLIAQAGDPKMSIAAVHIHDKGLISQAFQTDRVIYEPDALNQPQYVMYLAKTRSELVFPLHARGKVTGVLNLESPQPDAFDESARRIMLAFAEHAALALENARLFDAAGKHAYQMDLLNEITRTALESLDHQAMLKNVADRLRELFGSDYCYISLWDEANQKFSPGAATQGLRGHASVTPLSPGELSISEVALRTGQIMAVGDLSHSLYQPANRSATTRAVLSLPLIANRQKLGVAVIGFAGSRSFSSQDVLIAEQAAGQVALALAKLQSLELSQRRAREAETLRQATAALTNALDLREVLDQILAQLDLVLPYDSASVFLLEGNMLKSVAAKGFPFPERILGLTFPGDDRLLMDVARQGTPLVLEDAGQDERYQGWGGTSYVRGWMGVPLESHNELIGFLTLDSRQVGAFGKEQAALVQAFANQASVAIENARLFSDVQRLAVTDPLTGLYNRRGFYELARREIERARRFRRELSAILLDIDHFKRINDTYKHAAGDVVLREIAEACKRETREIDIIGRYGGEEIVLLLPETSLESAHIVAEHLRKVVAALEIPIGRKNISVTISLGIAEAIHGEPDLDTLIDRADAAMYASKQAGRNCVRSYQDRQSISS